MKPLEAVESAAKTAGVNTTSIGPRLGRSRSFFGAAKSQGNTPRVDTFADMADVCGYGVYLVPHDATPPDGAIAVDAPHAAPRHAGPSATA